MSRESVSDFMCDLQGVAHISTTTRVLSQGHGMTHGKRSDDGNTHGRQCHGRKLHLPTDSVGAASEPLPPVHDITAACSSHLSGRFLLASAGGSFNEDSTGGAGGRIPTQPAAPREVDSMRHPPSPLPPTQSATLSGVVTSVFGRAVSHQSFNAAMPLEAAGICGPTAIIPSPSLLAGLSGSSLFDHSAPSQSLMSIPDDDEPGICMAGVAPGAVLPGVPDDFRSASSQSLAQAQLLAGTRRQNRIGSIAESMSHSVRGGGGVWAQRAFSAAGVPARPDLFAMPAEEPLCEDTSDSAFSALAGGASPGPPVGMQLAGLSILSSGFTAGAGVGSHQNSRRSSHVWMQNNSRRHRSHIHEQRLCAGTSAPVPSCSDPLAPWGDPAAVVTGHVSEFESAFFTTDGTGYSGGLDACTCSAGVSRAR